jgi:hypothetical protein
MPLVPLQLLSPLVNNYRACGMPGGIHPVYLE